MIDHEEIIERIKNKNSIPISYKDSVLGLLVAILETLDVISERLPEEKEKRSSKIK